MINILANRYMIDSDWCFDELQKYIRPEHRVVVIPFSFREEQIYSNESWQQFYNPKDGLYYQGVVDAFERYGLKEKNIQWINYFTDSIEDSKRAVANADILYFTGGLPDKMMERLKAFDLIELIETHPGVILGFSAGALIQLERYHLSPDRDYPSFEYQDGLKMIRNIHVEVHFTHSDIQLESIEKVLKETGKPVYAMEDEGAIIVKNEAITTVGKVHYFSAD